MTCLQFSMWPSIPSGPGSCGLRHELYHLLPSFLQGYPCPWGVISEFCYTPSSEGVQVCFPLWLLGCSQPCIHDSHWGFLPSCALRHLPLVLTGSFTCIYTYTHIYTHAHTHTHIPFLIFSPIMVFSIQTLSKICLQFCSLWIVKTIVLHQHTERWGH